VLLVAYLVITVIGTIWMHSNAYDDHLAYDSLARRMLDCGNLIEPFSFRRISAYGGQTALLALAGLRGNVETSELLDRGIFQAITLLVVIDIARHRKLDLAVTTLVVLFVISLWDITSNSASHLLGQGTGTVLKGDDQTIGVDGMNMSASRFLNSAWFSAEQRADPAKRDWLTAEEALRLGLVNRVVPREQLEAETMQLAQRIALQDPFALRIASPSAGLPTGSPPPSRAATMIARVSLEKCLPRRESTIAFLCLIEAHLE